MRSFLTATHAAQAVRLPSEPCYNSSATPCCCAASLWARKRTARALGGSFCLSVLTERGYWAHLYRGTLDVV